MNSRHAKKLKRKNKAMIAKKVSLGKGKGLSPAIISMIEQIFLGLEQVKDKKSLNGLMNSKESKQLTNKYGDIFEKIEEYAGIFRAIDSYCNTFKKLPNPYNSAEDLIKNVKDSIDNSVKKYGSDILKMLANKEKELPIILVYTENYTDSLEFRYGHHISFLGSQEVQNLYHGDLVAYTEDMNIFHYISLKFHEVPEIGEKLCEELDLSLKGILQDWKNEKMKLHVKIKGHQNVCFSYTPEMLKTAYTPTKVEIEESNEDINIDTEYRKTSPKQKACITKIKYGLKMHALKIEIDANENCNTQKFKVWFTFENVLLQYQEDMKTILKNEICKVISLSDINIQDKFNLEKSELDKLANDLNIKIDEKFRVNSNSKLTVDTSSILYDFQETNDQLLNKEKEAKEKEAKEAKEREINKKIQEETATHKILKTQFNEINKQSNKDQEQKKRSTHANNLRKQALAREAREKQQQAEKNIPPVETEQKQNKKQASRPANVNEENLISTSLYEDVKIYRKPTIEDNKPKPKASSIKVNNPLPKDTKIITSEKIKPADIKIQAFKTKIEPVNIDIKPTTPKIELLKAEIKTPKIEVKTSGLQKPVEVETSPLVLQNPVETESKTHKIEKSMEGEPKTNTLEPQKLVEVEIKTPEASFLSYVEKRNMNQGRFENQVRSDQILHRLPIFWKITQEQIDEHKLEHTVCFNNTK